MSTAKYPNRDALRKANDIYLDAMRPFIVYHLKRVKGETVENLIEDALEPDQADKFWEKLDEDDDIESAIDFSYFPQIIQRQWKNAFGQRFNWDMNFQSILWLIRKGRNSCEHRGKKDLDSESVRMNLFLIADALGKINRPDEQREVEDIRDDLFSDNTAERLEKAEKDNGEYKRSLAEAEQRLATAESEKSEYAEKNAALSKQVDEKENQRKKLDKQLKRAKTQNDKYKKDIADTKQRLEKSEVAQTDYKERLETISNKLKDTKGGLAVVEAEKTAHKKHLKTISKELESVKAERSASEERLIATSNELASVQVEKNASEKHLVVTRNLLTTVAIGDQVVFPHLGTDASVRILDRRNVDKRNYLLELLEQKQPTIIYVQSQEKIDQLLMLVGPEKADIIGKHHEQTSDAEETEILKKLESRELIAAVSNTTFSKLTLSHCVEHFVFCHLVPGLDIFFDRCQPAFTSEKNTYLHLIYNNKEDIEGLNQWLTQKYPDKEALRGSYKKLQELAKANGGFVKLEEVCNALDMVELGIETGLTIFEELGFLERDGKGIITLFLSPMQRELEESGTYCGGEELKEETADFRTFQLEYSIEKIWKKILGKLNIDSEQILRESNIYSNVQPTTETEQDNITPPISNVWPLRTLSAFNSLRHRAAKEGDIWIEDERSTVRSPFASYHFESTESTLLDDGKNEKDYQRKYGLAMQFAQEHGMNALEQGIVQLIKDQDDPDYEFTRDEANMLRAFQNALTDFRTQSEQFSEAVEGENTADSETTVTSHPSKPLKTRKSSEPKPSTADKFREAKSLEERVEIGRQVAELRINATGLKGLSWKKIREKLGLKNDEFHEVVRLEDHFHESCVERIESFEDGWEYGGKLEVLLGFDPVGELVDRIEACKPKTGSKG